METKEEWLAAKRTTEQETAFAWAKQSDMPQVEGPEKALGWGERSRHPLMTAAHTALVVEGTWDEADWARLEDKARSITNTGWWIDQRDTDGTDLNELLDSATEHYHGTENPSGDPPGLLTTKTSALFHAGRSSSLLEESYLALPEATFLRQPVAEVAVMPAN